MLSLTQSAERSWFAIQAKPWREEMAASHLSSLGFEVLLPKAKTVPAKARSSRCIFKPLFTGYCFAFFCSATELDSVRYARGVLRVVSYGRSPAPVGNEVIDGIRSRLDDDGAVKLRPHAFRAGDEVLIESGPFQGFMGRVERECDDGKRVALLLEALHQAHILIEQQALTPLERQN